MEEKKKITIGVDFGTTNTCAAIVNRIDDIIDVFYLGLEANSQTMPTAVRFVGGNPEDVEVGRRAKRYSIIKSKEVFTSFKRLMQDESWKADPYIMNAYKLGDTQFTPTDMAAKILTHVYRVAQDTPFAATEPVDNILICVPAASTAYYKKEVVNAAIAAGFGDKDENGNVIKCDDGRISGITLMEEPFAAAYSYGLKNGFFDPNKSKNQNIMVYDFGGGTFDVSIINVVSEEGKFPEFTLLGNYGNAHLGGDDIDMVLMKIVAKQFLKETGIDLLDASKDNKGCTRRDVLNAQSILKEMVETAKIDFAKGDVEVLIEHLSIIHDNEEDTDCNLSVVVKREDFLKAIQPLLDKTIECAQEALKESKKSLDEINRFVLVGGSSKAPWVQDAVKAYIGKDPYMADNVDVIVAEGAAFRADGVARLLEIDEGDSHQGEGETIEKNKISHYYGVEVRGGYFIPLIEKGLVFDETHTSYSGSFKCTNPNDSGTVHIMGWATQDDILERDEQGNPVLEDGQLVCNRPVHYIKPNGERLFQSIGEFLLEVPRAAPNTLDITLMLTILNDNSLRLEVKVGEDEPQIQTW